MIKDNLAAKNVFGPVIGGGRRAWSKYNGLVYTVGIPKGRKNDDDI
jgi:hypothetical protein